MKLGVNLKLETRRVGCSSKPIIELKKLQNKNTLKYFGLDQDKPTFGQISPKHENLNRAPTFSSGTDV